MKFETAKKLIIKGAERKFRYLSVQLKKYLRIVSKAKTPEEILLAKGEFLSEVFDPDNLLLRDTDCIYCLLNIPGKSGCAVCEYGKIHGICDNNNSLYSEIILLLDELKTIFIAKYAYILKP